MSMRRMPQMVMMPVVHDMVVMTVGARKRVAAMETVGRRSVNARMIGKMFLLDMRVLAVVRRSAMIGFVAAIITPVMVTVPMVSVVPLGMPSLA